MKKLVTAILLLTLLAVMIVPAVSSKEYVRAADSATISQQIKDQLQIGTEDTVVRIYRMSIKEAFTEYDTVDQALVSDALDGIYYAVMDSEGRVNYYENASAGYLPVKEDNIRIPMDLYLEGNIQIFEQIGSDGIIYYRYFITTPGGEDSAIYYKTSQGEYVYYYAPDIGQNLFPLKDFISYQNAPYPLPGSREYQALILKFKDFYANPISENPWFFICAGSLLLITGIITAAVILYRRKFKPYMPPEQQ